MQCVNAIVLRPLTELFTSISIYSYYQYLSYGGDFFVGGSERALLFQPTPFHFLNDSPVWSLGVYFKFW